MGEDPLYCADRSERATQPDGSTGSWGALLLVEGSSWPCRPSGCLGAATDDGIALGGGTGGPPKPGFGLSGAVPHSDKVFPPLVRVFVLPFGLDLQCRTKHEAPPLRMDDAFRKIRHSHSSQNRA